MGNLHLNMFCGNEIIVTKSNDDKNKSININRTKIRTICATVRELNQVLFTH